MSQKFGIFLIVALIETISACAIDPADKQQGNGSDPNASATDDPSVVGDETVAEFPEHFDPARAATIAKAKMSLTSDAISPQAAACGTHGDTSSNVRTNDAAFTGAAQQRSGSSTGCTALGVLQPTDDALYFCFVFASDGTWTYNQNLRTGVRGWTRDDLLRGDGSFRQCP